jgi:lambda family phage portal protein
MVGKVLEWIAPRWTLRRKLAQQAIRTLKAAETGPSQSSWVRVGDGPNAPPFERKVIVARANRLYLDDPYVHGLVNLMVNRIVGPGSRLRATTSDSSFNAYAERAFVAWMDDCDLYQEMTFAEIERLLVIKRMLDGGVFIRKRVEKDGRRGVPKIEILEYSRLQEIGAVSSGNSVYDGVEVDATGRVIAYHFSRPSAGMTSFATVRVPASEILHISSFRRPGQYLGLPEITPIIPYCMHLSEIIEAELINKKVEACLGVAIKQSDLFTRAAVAEQVEGETTRAISLSPGGVYHLLPGEEIQVIDPKRPGSQFMDFAGAILQAFGRPFGVSREMITGNKSEVNYSSARHSELEFRQFIEPYRRQIRNGFLRPIYRWAMEVMADFGELRVPANLRDSLAYLSHTWIHRGAEWVDPQNEAEAKQKKLDMCLTTLEREASELGLDWRELARQRAAEIRFLEGLGIGGGDAE